MSDVLVWTGMTGSTVNLASITVERYLKVVHPVWSKKKLRNWMICSAAGFAWIFSFAYNLGLMFQTTKVIDGVCYPYMMPENGAVRMAHVIWYFTSFYVITLLIIIFGYWRILVVIRRQARVMAGHSAAGSSIVQTQSSHIQTSVIKTMVLVSAFFTISQLPYNITFLFVNVYRDFFPFTAYFTSVFIAFLYICTNPFIYAIKFDPVKQVLLRLIPGKISDQPNETINMT